MADQVSLPSERFEPATYNGMPSGARDALSFAFTGFGILPGAVMARQYHAKPLTEADVPNGILAMRPGKRVFLMTPTPDKAGRAAHECAVIWRGEHYHDALAVARTVLPTDNPWPSRIGENSPYGLSFTRLEYSGGIVTAAATAGWTTLMIAPSGTPVEQPFQ